jgi:hypothetical protein
MADNKYTGGIQINTSGFEVQAKSPVDSRFRVINSAGLNEILTYEGLITYNEADKTYYQFQNGAWKALFVSSVAELETKIKDYVTGEALTVMEFKGVTATLPSTTGLTKGDFYKVTNTISIGAANNAEGVAVTAKAGDSIIYNGNSKWYLIPSGDDIENTWRPIKAGDNTLESTETLELVAGTNVSITEAGGKVTISATDTDTHHQAKLVVGNDKADVTTAAATNGNVFVNLVENGSVRSATNIKGTGKTTVTSDANGVITIHSTDADTRRAIKVDGTQILSDSSTTALDLVDGAGIGVNHDGSGKVSFGHTNSITAGTATPATSTGTANSTLSHGGKFSVPKITYDAQGHVTSVGSVIFQLPTDNNSWRAIKLNGTQLIASSSSTALNFVAGTGLKWETTANAGEAKVNFDDTVTFILDCND